MQTDHRLRPSTPPRRVDALDLLRAVAVAAVVLYHFGFNGPTSNGTVYIALPLLGDIGKYGRFGVQLFFTISGFVIAFSAAGRTPLSFAIARFARLYPAFIVCMTLTFIVTHQFGEPHFHVTFKQWLANLFIASVALHQPYIDSVYWTLVLEVTFYAWVFFFMMLGLFQRHLKPVVFVWLLLSALNEFVIGSHVLRKVLLTDQSGFFAAGLLIHELFAGRRDAAVQALLGLATAMAVAGAVVNLRIFRERSGVDIDNWIVAAISLGIIVITMLAARVRRLPLPAPLVLALGGITYPLYLLHQQIGYVVFMHTGPAPALPAALSILGAIVLVSWLVWRFIEIPLRPLAVEILNRVATVVPWRPATPPPPVPTMLTPRRLW